MNLFNRIEKNEAKLNECLEAEQKQLENGMEWYY